jgi:hypothetical protein
MNKIVKDNETTYFYVIKNFVDDITKIESKNFTLLSEYLVCFVNAYGKGCIDYLNDETTQALYIRQNNEQLFYGLAKGLNSLCFKQEEREVLKELMGHFDYL